MMEYEYKTYGDNWCVSPGEDGDLLILKNGVEVSDDEEVPSYVVDMLLLELGAETG